LHQRDELDLEFTNAPKHLLVHGTPQKALGAQRQRWGLASCKLQCARDPVWLVWPPPFV
jgi:hypothetical protein